MYGHGILPTSTLKDVENIRCKTKEKTQIREFATLLSAINEGSVLITWITLFHCEKTNQCETSRNDWLMNALYHKLKIASMLNFIVWGKFFYMVIFSAVELLHGSQPGSVSAIF